MGFADLGMEVWMKRRWIAARWAHRNEHTKSGRMLSIVFFGKKTVRIVDGCC
jgi:hypothetical protein